MTDLLVNNLLSPIALSFALGVVAKMLRSELTFPREVYIGLSLYLLFALGLHGGVELSHTSFRAIVAPAFATIALGVATPTLAAFRSIGDSDDPIAVLVDELRRHLPEGAELGVLIGPAVPYGEVADVIEDIVEAYLSLRQRPDELFVDAVKRLGVEPFKAGVYGNPDQEPADRRRAVAA